MPSNSHNKLRYEIPIKTSDGLVTFDCINLSWVSRLHEERVTFLPELIPDHKEHATIQVTILHHPFHWLHVSSYREFRRRVRAGADIVLTGHQHEWSVLEVSDTDSGSTVQLEGAVLQDRKLADYSSFSVMLINPGDKSYRPERFDLVGNIYSSVSIGEWGSFRPLRIAAPDGQWAFSETFEAQLSDLGMALRAGGGREVGLDDVFIFPKLQRGSRDEKRDPPPGSLEELFKRDDGGRGFVIQGDEKSGRSSLLKQLVRVSLNNGFVPLLISGHDIRHSDEHELDKLVERRVKGQLIGGSIDAYRQLPKKDRMLFVDDIDESPIKSEHALALVLSRLTSRFGRIVVTSGEAYETSQIVSEASDSPLSEMPTYRILQFGYLGRTQLIKKWVSLNATEAQSEDDRVSRVHDAENFISSVLKRGVVPAYPVYLLALLHAESAKREDSLEEGGVGHYYEYLITQGILEGGIRRELLDEIYDYCTQLAWFVSNSGRSHVSVDEFRRFNDGYSREWSTVDFTMRKDELIRARLIAISGDSVTFRYSYLFYYFVARFLSLNLDDDLVTGYIRDSCAHLYVRERANVLVFLTHFTTRSDIIDLILSALAGQFPDTQVVRFNEQGDSIDALLRDLPKLTYQGGDPLTHREAEAAAKDEMHVDEDFPDHPIDADASSIPCRLACVFRSIEMVGQILKVRYSKFKRIDKEIMIEQMIVAPLQALESFYGSLRRNPAALIAHFKATIAEAGRSYTEAEKEALAIRITGIVVLAISFVFVKKVAEALSAEVLMENLESVVAGHDDLTYKLVGLACYLDGQRELPREMIRDVLRLGKGSLVVESLVRLFVVYRMHMFRTKPSDVSWAKDILKIPKRIEVQALIHALR